VAKAAARKRNRAPMGCQSRRSQAKAKPFPWKTWGTWLGVGALVIAVGAFLVSQASSSEEDPAITALAAQSAGGAIEVHTGSAHTVYHSVDPLPTSSRPRLYGKPTLVWFSGTWCEFCEIMVPFAHNVGAGFTDRLVFVEKSIGHDRSAAQRYGVRGTPTFVLIDETGGRISQFNFERRAIEDTDTSAFNGYESRTLQVHQCPGHGFAGCTNHVR